MRGKFSLNQLLHNKKLMVLFSVISALAIWGAVHTVSSEDVTTITKTANLSLENTYAGNTGMKIFTGVSTRVSIKVRGSWFVIHRLTEDNFRIIGDYNEIKGVGEWPVYLKASKNSNDSDFSIIDVVPGETTVFCDYVDSKTFPINVDIDDVKIDESTGYVLATPIVAVENGTVKIEGPKSVISKIVSVTAKVDEPKTISEVTTFSATLTAYDENQKPVDTELCSFAGIAKDNKVDINVPVHVKRKINLTYYYKHKPNGFKDISEYITISPSSIEILGTPEQVETFADDISDIGTFDFNHLNLNNMKRTIELDIPQGITVLEGTKEVTVTFNFDDFVSKTINLNLTKQNTIVINKPSGVNYTLTTQNINVVLIGNKKSIDKIKPSNLSVEVHMDDNRSAGVREFRATVKVSGYNDVWVYYGKSEPSGYVAYMTIE